MNHPPSPDRLLTRTAINERVRTEAQTFIEQENQRYFAAVQEAVSYVRHRTGGRCLTMLSGPSSSGKTTTAHLLQAYLRADGIDAHTVSLDDFYRGRERAPRLPNGSYDYESPEALDLDRLQTCMQELLREGRTRLPRFDFTTGRPAPEERELSLRADSVVIFEGIHALNPVFEQHIPQENVVKLFVNTLSPIYEGETKVLARRDLRLIRRLLRDDRFRNSPITNTLDMWQQVTRGEALYLFPYAHQVDMVIDTTHAYEPCLFAGELLPGLRAVPADDPYIDTVRHLITELEPFLPLSEELVPPETLLREFIGGGLYG